MIEVFLHVVFIFSFNITYLFYCIIKNICRTIFNKLLFKLCMWVCAHECRCQQRPEVLDLLGSGVLGNWELTLGSLKEQYTLLTAEPTVQTS